MKLPDLPPWEYMTANERALAVFLFSLAAGLGFVLGVELARWACWMYAPAWLP